MHQKLPSLANVVFLFAPPIPELLVGLPQASARVQNPSFVSWSASQTGLLEAPRRWGANAMELKKQQQPSQTRVAADAREAACCEPVLGAGVFSGICADGFLGMSYGYVTWPFGAWMCIWHLVFSILMDSRCFWFFLSDLRNIIHRIYVLFFGKNRSYTIWSAHFCKKRRLKFARKGWLHRLRSRIRRPGDQYTFLLWKSACCFSRFVAPPVPFVS